MVLVFRVLILFSKKQEFHTTSNLEISQLNKKMQFEICSRNTHSKETLNVKSQEILSDWKILERIEEFDTLEVSLYADNEQKQTLELLMVTREVQWGQDDVK